MEQKIRNLRNVFLRKFLKVGDSIYKGRGIETNAQTTYVGSYKFF